MPRAKGDTAKSDQYLVRVTEDQADALAVLQLLLVGDSPAAVLRKLLDEAVEARSEDPDFAAVLTARVNARTASRRAGLSSVRDVGNSS